MIESPGLKKFVQVVVAVVVFLLLILTGIRLLLTETFVRFEYNQDSFPADPYGMTKEERLKYAPIALEFLLNGAEDSFLGDLKFNDGTILYNERELSHMVDVQALTQVFLKVWYVSAAGFLAIWVWAWRGNWLDEFRRMLSVAGLSTIVVLGTLILLMLLSFDMIFVGFHRIFFQGDTWLFLYSDTLIRLFPEKFWRDAFILVGAFSFLGGITLWLGLRKKSS